MRFFMLLAALALMAAVAYWALSGARPAQRNAASGQALGTGSGAQTGGFDPSSTLNNARGAAQRVQDETFKRAAEMDRDRTP